MKAVHYGAGNIGRGFIGLMLSRSGYEVIFVDVNETLVSRLREKGRYSVVLANDAADRLEVAGVTAVHGTDLEQVASRIAEADLVTTAVGVQLLERIAEGMARGIRRRLANPARPLHIIACENTIGGSSKLKEYVYGHLDEEERRQCEVFVRFPNAAVDRIVPLQRNSDPLEVKVEPFCEWIVDRTDLLPGGDTVAGVQYVDDLTPYIERKLFTVNTGHCCAAYLGCIRGRRTIQESMSDEVIAEHVRGVLEETGALLIRKFGFDPSEHKEYIHKIIDRFTNRHVMDEVERVGRSPIRKLAANDRLVSPALQAHAAGIEPHQLARGIAAALHFESEQDEEAAELQSVIRHQGVHGAITRFTGISSDHPVFNLIMKQYESLRK